MAYAEETETTELAPRKKMGVKEMDFDALWKKYCTKLDWFASQKENMDDTQYLLIPVIIRKVR